MTHGANPGLVSSLLKQALLEIGRAFRPARRASPPARGLGRTGAATATSARFTWLSATRRNAPRRKRAGRVRQHLVGRRRSSTKACSLRSWAGAPTSGTGPPMPRATASAAMRDLPRPARLRHPRAQLDAAGGPVPRIPGDARGIDLDRRLPDAARDSAGAVTYRPTVHYAYHPCDDAVLSVYELAGDEWAVQRRSRVMRDEIASGIDELGVLLMGNDAGVYWYGSRLSIEEARELAPVQQRHQPAGGGRHPGRDGVGLAQSAGRRGGARGDRSRRRAQAAGPYLGQVVGVWGDWTPLRGRTALYRGSRRPRRSRGSSSTSGSV